MSNELELRHDYSVVAEAEAIAKERVRWQIMWEQAEAFVASGFLPSSIKTPAQAIAIIKTGEELGLPPMLSLRSIHIINGRPTLSADLMASLVQREIDRRGDGMLVVAPPTAESCTVHYRRWGWDGKQSYTYTMDDARRAGLSGKETWKAHPAAMLRARATAAVCRMGFPDVIAGLYAPEEIDDSAYAVVEIPTATVLDASADELHANDRGTSNERADGAVERIDTDTGEIVIADEIVRYAAEILRSEADHVESKTDVTTDIRVLRDHLKLNDKDLLDHAKSVKINLTSIDGLKELRRHLAQRVEIDAMGRTMTEADSSAVV